MLSDSDTEDRPWKRRRTLESPELGGEDDSTRNWRLVEIRKEKKKLKKQLIGS